MSNEKKETLKNYNENSLENDIENIQPTADQILNTATILCQEEQVELPMLEESLKIFGDDYKDPEELALLSYIIPLVVQNPTTPVNQLKLPENIGRDELLKSYKWMQSSNMLKTVMMSHYYPGYMMIRYAQTFFEDLAKDSQYLIDVIEHKPLTPKRLEVHVTNGTCNYRCTMCLWHVNNQAKYKENGEILSKEDWNKVFDQAAEGGTKVIIFSGGGEPLLRSDFGEVIDYANQRGLYTMIYTNGSLLEKLSKNDDKRYKSLLDADWLRVSMHSTDEDTYADLVHLPRESKPLSKVIRGMKRLIKDRDMLEKPLKIGIGFVVQHQNFNQVSEMAQLAKELGVDMLNIREDCIDITQHLSPEEKEILYEQLRTIRENLDKGDYDEMQIDFADTMITQMNGWEKSPRVETPSECRVHLYRSAIDPYGRVATCDLVSEPYFASDNLTLGFISKDKDYAQVLEESANKKFKTEDCSNCMPGQQAINALWNKVLEDNKEGIKPEDQPLLFSKL